MTEPDRIECPVCLESFILPQLLPCGHTFCYKCIQGFKSESAHRRELNCPLCRTSCLVDKDGYGFLSNYFIKTERIPKLCQYCEDFSRKVNSICKECFRYCCKICHTNHLHIPNHDKGNHKTTTGVSHLADTFGNVITTFKCRHVCTFIPDYPKGEHSPKNIHCIRRSGAYAYLVIEGRSYVYKYNIKGALIQRICTPSVPFGMIERKNGSLLVVFPENQKVMVYSFGAWHKFLDVSYIPTDVCETLEETVAICGQSQDNIAQFGIVEIFSSVGHLIRTICRNDKNEFIFKPLTSLVVNPKVGSIAACSESQVSIFLSNGERISVYEGSFPFARLILGQRRQFKPIDVCCHSNGHFLISEESDGYVHVLYPDGKFIGTLVGSQESGNGLPGRLSFDDLDFIWIEDIKHKSVKIFKYTFFENYFARHILTL